MIDYFAFFLSYHEAIKDMPDSERLCAYDAIVRYGLYGEVIDGMTPTTRIIFTLAKPTLDSSRERRRVNTENGKKGGRPKGSTSKPSGFSDENPSVLLEKEKEEEEETEKEMGVESAAEGARGNRATADESAADSGSRRSSSPEQEFEEKRRKAIESLNPRTFQSDFKIDII